VRQKKSLRQKITGATSKVGYRTQRLANPGADKPAVVLDAHPATGEKVSHRRDGFLRVFRARTHRQDKVAEGEFRALFKYQSIFLH
jgi:hypothetical protein